jgi:hypothetical protein
MRPCWLEDERIEGAPQGVMLDDKDVQRDHGDQSLEIRRLEIIQEVTAVINRQRINFPVCSFPTQLLAEVLDVSNHLCGVEGEVALDQENGGSEKRFVEEDLGE